MMATFFSADQPLDARQDDRLNRGAFADRIASILLGQLGGTSLIIGVHGPWGDGKTTILNLLRAELSKTDSIILRDFNPWRLTDDDALLRSFVSILANAVGASLSTWLERAMAKTAWWARLAKIAAVLIAPIYPAAKTAAGLLSKLEEVARKGNSCGLEELHSRISEHLKLSPKRVVIIIDDIDRLDKHEVHSIFRLIKACADFPNVSYVLAFDDTAVSKALGERYGGSDEQAGRSFLEKIIQVPLKLPVAAKEDLRTLCFGQVDYALSAAGIELTKQQVGEFVTGFDSGAAIRLTTPRAAKRYGNCLMFSLPMLKGEASVVDLLLVEALRAFYPEVYNIVRDNHTDFSGIEESSYGNNTTTPRMRILLDEALSRIPEEHAHAVKRLLTDLFPRVNSAYGNMHYTHDSIKRWTLEQRISSPSYCPRYFSYSIPLNDIADSEISSLLGSAISKEEATVQAWLTTHLKGTKAKRVIEKLRSIEKSIDLRAVEIIAVCIAKQGAAIPNPQALFSFAEPLTQAAILISHLLRRIPDRTRRVNSAKLIVEAADPLWFGAECVRWLYVTDKPEKEESNTLTELETKEVRKDLVKRIKDYAETGAPLFDTELAQEASLLSEWRRDEGRDPVQAHLLHVFSKDTKQTARFLLAMTPLAWTMGGGPPHVSDFGADQLNSVERFIDLDIMAELVRNNCPGNFDHPNYYHDDDVSVEQRLAEQFMFAYNNKKNSLEALPVHSEDKPHQDKQ